MEQFLEVVGYAANFIEVISLGVVLLLFLRARQKFKRYLKARETASSDRPWAVIVGIGGDISGQVTPFLAQQELGDVSIESYTRAGHLPTQKFYDVLRDMLRIKKRLSEAGATEVHLFYRGPVTLAMGIGSIFDNWVPVKIYEHVEGSYRLDFVLEKGTVLGLIDADPDGAVDEILG
jgi:hypothetical protein